MPRVLYSYELTRIAARIQCFSSHHWQASVAAGLLTVRAGGPYAEVHSPCDIGGVGPRSFMARSTQRSAPLYTT
eukprot:5051965-Amphidinium_carterae.1